MALRENLLNRPTVLRDLADDFFPVPDPGLSYWSRRPQASIADPLAPDTDRPATEPPADTERAVGTEGGSES
jgi:hypothetical protein